MFFDDLSKQYISISDLAILSNLCSHDLFSNIKKMNFFNVLKNIASKDAYFGFFGTVVGAFITYRFTRMSEIIGARYRIIQLRAEIEFLHIEIDREINRCREGNKPISIYRSKVQILHDFMVQLYIQLIILKRRGESKTLHSFIRAVRYHLCMTTDNYELTDEDEKVLDYFREYFKKIWSEKRNFLSFFRSVSAQIIFFISQRNFLKTYIKK